MHFLDPTHHLPAGPGIGPSLHLGIPYKLAGSFLNGREGAIPIYPYAPGMRA